MALTLLLSACGGGPEPGELAVVEGFAGLVAADEPNATVIGREVLGRNGGAADAAVAMAFAMSVTLPSRAGLGGGGQCLFFEAKTRTAEAIVFPPLATPSGTVVPATARAMALLHARHGLVRWELLLQPAENLARFGHPVSRAFAADIAAGRDRLAADPELAKLLLTAEGRPLAEGARLRQPELSTLLGGLRQKGAGYLHSGLVPARLAEAAAAAGLPLEEGELRAWVPEQAAPLAVEVGSDRLYLPPASTPGGATAADLWRRLEGGWSSSAAARAGLVSAASQSAGLHSAGAPAAGFVVADRFGDAAACSFTMNALFGRGRLLPGSGLLLAAAPEGPVTLAVAIRGNENTGRLRYAAASGTALALTQVALETMVAERPLEEALRAPRLWMGPDGRLQQEGAAGTDPTRVPALYCPDGLQDEEERAKCRVESDPRGHGLAAVAR